mmetsp:Transcript_92034/g.263682  ORF Transcript_92034/g.263682 Transcript_92034/m.263682 type:complete len:260 (-) Transcript_92034:335-1114(-)
MRMTTMNSKTMMHSAALLSAVHAVQIYRFGFGSSVPCRQPLSVKERAVSACPWAACHTVSSPSLAHGQHGAFRGSGPSCPLNSSSPSPHLPSDRTCPDVGPSSFRGARTNPGVPNPCWQRGPAALRQVQHPSEFSGLFSNASSPLCRPSEHAPPRHHRCRRCLCALIWTSRPFCPREGLQQTRQPAAGADRLCASFPCPRAHNAGLPRPLPMLHLPVAAALFSLLCASPCLSIPRLKAQQERPAPKHPLLPPRALFSFS